MKSTLKHSTLVGLAVLAHEANRAYAASMGDDSVQPWVQAGEAQQKSILSGVQMHLDNPDTTPEAAHEAWLAAKLADGWQYGEVKDVQAKIHPCIRPYAELPPEQRSKDWIFRGVVLAGLQVLSALEEQVHSETRHELQGSLQEYGDGMPVDLKRVRYVHTTRTPWTDHITGSSKVFEAGKSYVLPTAMATKLLRLTGMFEEGDATEAPSAGELAQTQELEAAQTQDDTARKTEQDQQHAIADLKVRVGMMEADALRSYAFTNFQQKFAANTKVETMRQRVGQWIDQFGVVQ